jgi:lipoprotein-anchoring transpeptidase ErfK/SrfK
VGYATSSHGCVNIGQLSQAMWIFKHTPIGALVYIYSQKAGSA